MGSTVAVKAFVKAITEILSKPEDVKALADKEISTGQQKLYEAKRKQTKELLDELEVNFGGQKFRDFLTMYKNIDKTASDNYVDAETYMGQLGTNIINTNRELAAGLDTKRKEVVTKSALVANKIKALPAGKAFKKFIQELKDDLADITALGPNGNLEVCVSALQQLAELEGRVTKLAQGVMTVAGNPTQFQMVRNKIKELRTLLDDEALKETRKARRKELITKLKELQEKAFATEPDQSLANLEHFKKAINDEIVEAKGAKKTRDECAVLVTNITNLLKTLGITEKSPANYYKDFKGRLDEAEKKSKTADSEVEAKTDLTALQTELKTYEPMKTKDRLEAIAKREKGVVDGQKKAQEEKMKFEADLKDFDHVLEDLKKALSVPDADTELYDAVSQLRKQAFALAKSGDYAEAQKTLEKAKETAAAAMKNPQGRKLDARAKLPALVKQWEKSVGEFRKAATDLADAIKTWGEKTPGVESAKITKGADAIQKLGEPKLFDAIAFDKVTGILLEPSLPAPTRKAAREEGLAIIRRYRNLLLRDKLLTECQNNPFMKGFLGAAGNLLLKLNSLELVILTCV
jgi:tetratricopeptide (TPR) repeat protein